MWDRGWAETYNATLRSKFFPVKDSHLVTVRAGPDQGTLRRKKAPYWVLTCYTHCYHGETCTTISHLRELWAQQGLRAKLTTPTRTICWVLF